MSWSHWVNHNRYRTLGTSGERVLFKDDLTQNLHCFREKLLSDRIIFSIELAKKLEKITKQELISGCFGESE